MLETLQNGLHSKNPFVRKGSAWILKLPKAIARRNRTQEELRRRPPLLANSFPKSGTHLLDQIVAVFPGRSNYGAFLSSMTGSYQFRELAGDDCARYISDSVSGEIVRAHLFYGDAVASALSEMNFVHYFIYRDLRDVVLSGVHYVLEMNRWHRLSPYFRKSGSLEAAINLSIQGFEDSQAGILQPNLAERFSRYAGWLDHSDTCAVKFEDLTSSSRDQYLERMVEFYRGRSLDDVDNHDTLARIKKNLIPQNSHTFRSGKSGGWQEQFTQNNRDVFKEIAGDLLIRLGYESDDKW